MWAIRFTHFGGDKEAARFPLKVFSVFFLDIYLIGINIFKG